MVWAWCRNFQFFKLYTALMLIFNCGEILAKDQQAVTNANFIFTCMAVPHICINSIYVMPWCLWIHHTLPHSVRITEDPLTIVLLTTFACLLLFSLATCGLYRVTGVDSLRFSFGCHVRQLNQRFVRCCKLQHRVYEFRQTWCLCIGQGV